MIRSTLFICLSLVHLTNAQVLFTKKCKDCVGYSCSGSIYIHNNSLSFWKKSNADTTLKPDTVLSDIRIKWSGNYKNSIFIKDRCEYKIKINQDSYFSTYQNGRNSLPSEIIQLDSLLSYAYKVFTPDTIKRRIDNIRRMHDDNYDDSLYREELRVQGKDSASIDLIVEARREAHRKMSKSIHDKYTYEWRINGKSIIGQDETVILSPSMNRFDTIYYHTLEGNPDKWGKLLCKIPEKAEYYFGVNPCCGGMVVYKVNGLLKNVTIFNLKNSEKGKMYLARFGSSGTVLKEGKPVVLGEPCQFDVSAMTTQRPLITIELIDTGKVVDNAMKNFDDQRPEDSDNRIESLNCFQGKDFYNNEGIYHYLKLGIIKRIDYVWFDTNPLIVDFDARSGKIDLRLGNNK